MERSSTTLVDYAYIGPRVAQRSYGVPDVDYEPAYDNLGRITSADYGASVAKFDYSYVTNENNIYRKTFDHRSGDPYNEYTYDDLDRLTGVTYHDSDTEAFNMDDLGNRDGNQTLRDDGTVNFTVDDDTNRYTAIGGNSITHDDAGNMTVDKDGYQYTYDYENRIVKIEDVNDVTVATYAYDALGRRIRKIDSIADETTLYYYNPDWQVLAEYNSSGTLQRYFIYGNYIDEPVVMNDGTNDYYYAHDHLYSVVALLEADGDVTERYEYDAYGKATIYTDHGGDNDWFDGDETTAAYSDIGNPYLFTGRRLDVLDSDNFKLIYYRHRWYDTYTARFLQYDPLGYVDGMNLYQYVLSRSQVAFDPYGLWGESIHYDATKDWAMRPRPGPKFPKKAAKAIAKADKGVDSLKKGGTGPVPWGDFSYHFNRNLDNWSNDTRLAHFREHLALAKFYCHRALDNPKRAAKELGTSLHPLQDWVAHGDYGKYDHGDIFVIHNSTSPDDPDGKFPDEPDLDAVNGPNGRPAGKAMIWKEYKSIKDGVTGTKKLGYAIYVTGHKRRTYTRRLTQAALWEFRDYVQANGACKCKKYFGIK